MPPMEILECSLFISLGFFLLIPKEKSRILLRGWEVGGGGLSFSGVK